MTTPLRTAALGLCTLLLAAAISAPALAEEPAPRLRLQVTGTVSAVPDVAVVTAGVLSEKPTAAEALSDNNGAMNALVGELKAAGVAERDIRTANFSIEPVYVYPQPREGEEQQPPRITGYRVSNLVQVRIRDLSAAGGLLDKVVRLGANAIQGIGFEVDDDAALRDDARRQAMAEAKRRAELYAEAGGFSIGRIVDLGESVAGPRPMMAARMEMAKAAMDSVPVAAGEQDVEVILDVAFELLPK